MVPQNIVDEIKALAKSLGFVALGIARAHPIPKEVRESYISSLQEQGVGDMGYLERNLEVRFDPDKLVSGARSIIVGAFNYFPEKTQRIDAPQIAYYAYGKDYHRVVKDKLFTLLKYLQERIETPFSSRVFVDSAPLMERYWAVQSGVGKVGRNGLLIVPHFGSFCFLGEIVTTLELPADAPSEGSPCGRCMRCVEHCPAQAISKDGRFSPTRCLSYQTIEHHGSLDPKVVAQLGERIYGCDACQLVCPHNRFAYPHQEGLLKPVPDLLEMTSEDWKNLDNETFEQLFEHSAVQRVGFDGLRRNINSLLPSEDLEASTQSEK